VVEVAGLTEVRLEAVCVEAAPIVEVTSAPPPDFEPSCGPRVVLVVRCAVVVVAAVVEVRVEVIVEFANREPSSPVSISMATAALAMTMLGDCSGKKDNDGNAKSLIVVDRSPPSAATWRGRSSPPGARKAGPRTKPASKAKVALTSTSAPILCLHLHLKHGQPLGCVTSLSCRHRLSGGTAATTWDNNGPTSSDAAAASSLVQALLAQAAAPRNHRIA